MKVKEISRTANVAWSPSALQSIHLACGTVAQQLDATFSTSAKLEIFSLDLTSPGLELPLLGAIESPQRFHKLVWSAYGVHDNHPSGLIIGGSDNGTITIWSADKIMSGTPDALVSQSNQHVGAVRALDINPFQPNLLASGASESEIYIWDLNNPSSAMSPGNKTHPLEDISGVAWNRQVQHILASTQPGGRSVVWDLRKNEPIIQVADSTSHVRCNAIVWHPDVATQMATASGDDHAPIIQLWDLRYATAPMRTLERHKRGILSLAWCPQDSDLLLSASKDNQVLCWNPNSEEPGGEVVYELPATSQWIFECHWCPRNPAIISTASFDGHVSMYSLLGGGGGEARQPAEEPPAPVATDDIFAGIAAARAQPQPIDSSPLKKPPKWFRRPCGAQFAFGGKLVSFGNTHGAATPRSVHISQVVTEHTLLQRSNTLEESLSRQQFGEFCEQKVQESSNTQSKNIWNFLKVTFEPEPRRQYLKLLGYDTDELSKKFSTWSKMSVSTLASAGGLDVQELSQKLSVLGDEGDGMLRQESETSSTAAVFGSEGENHAFDNLSAGTSTEVSARTSKKASSASFMGVPPVVLQTSSEFTIPVDSDTDGMLCKALLVGNFEAAVDICVSADRMVEAMVLAVAGGADLLQRTQQVFFQKSQSQVSKLLSAVVTRNWTELTRHGNLENWREILAALVTYASPEDFAPLCDLLGERLESELEGRYRDNASLCYICSGNVDKFVECWNVTAGPGDTSGLILQDLIEKVVLLRRAVERERRQFGATSSDVLSEKLRMYAGLLASQGSLATALTYLNQSGVAADSSAVLRDRLYHAQGCGTSPTPEFPFQTTDVQPPLPPTPIVPVQEDLTPTQPVHMQAGTTGLIQTQAPTVPSNPYAAGMPGLYQQPSTTQPTRMYTPVTEPSGITNPSFGSTATTAYPSVNQPLGTIPQPSTSSPYNVQGVPLSDLQAQVRAGIGQVTPPSNPTIFNPAAAVPQPSVSHPPPSVARNEPPGTTRVWNDPPLLKSKQPLGTAAPPAPIMAPIMAPVMAPVQDPQPPHNYPSHLPPSSDHQRQPSPITKRPPSPPPVIQKLPIPPEHMVMVTSFDAMLDRCKAAASTTAVRRKTDDISRKLAILYDLLRESKVSPDVLQGLHYIAQDAQTMNYQSGLMRHTQMVSAGNFSEISSFMPGIKALLQLGLQLRA